MVDTITTGQVQYRLAWVTKDIEIDRQPTQIGGRSRSETRSRWRRGQKPQVARYWGTAVRQTLENPIVSGGNEDEGSL